MFVQDIFKIRDEAKFSDGSDVTADDAVFSYEILRDEGLPSFRASIIKTIAGVEALDGKRVKFTFAETAPLRGRIESAGGLPIFSRASHEAAGIPFEDTRLEPLIGSGAYVLGELDVGKRIVYARNPDYWGNDLPLMKGRNNFDSIRIALASPEVHKRIEETIAESLRTPPPVRPIEQSSLQSAYALPATPER